MRDDDDGFGMVRGGCVWLCVFMLPDKTSVPVSCGETLQRWLQVIGKLQFGGFDR
jgi:hypothetical protein